MKARALSVNVARHGALKALATGLIATTLAACGGGGSDGGGGGPAPLPATVVYRADDASTRGAPELYLAGSGESLTGKLAGGLSEFKLTADRRSVVFVGAPATAADALRLYRVDLARPRQLVKLSRDPVSGGNVSHFQISPDGTKVVYSGDMDIDGVSEIYLVNLDGSDEHKINGSVGSPASVELFLPARGAWSPDGKLILQSVRALSDGHAVGLNEHDVTLGTPNSTRITANPWPTNVSINDPSWLPNSNTFAFISNISGGRDNLVVMQRGATNSLFLASAGVPTGGAVMDYAAAPDSSGIVYRASSGSAARFEVFRTNFGASGLPNAAPFRLGGAQTQGLGVSSFALSPDGSTVAYSADETTAGTFELFTASATAAGASTTTSSPLPAGSNVVDFAFTPKGNAVVYRSGFASALRTNSDFDLSVVSLATPGRATRLNGAKTPGGAVSFDYQVTPDGNAVVYRGDLLANEVLELFYTRFDGAGASTRINAPLATGTDVDGFDAH